jgi:hypothetical protein
MTEGLSGTEGVEPAENLFLGGLASTNFVGA